MSPKMKIAIWILVMIPVCFALFMLFLVNPVLMLLGVVLLLAVLVLLKWKFPQCFSLHTERDGPLEPGESGGGTIFMESRKSSQRVYMVLIRHQAPNVKRIEVNKKEFTIGRSGDCDYIIPSEYVSRKHMIIEYDENTHRCYAKVFGTHCKTYLNKSPMQPEVAYALRRGDLITIDNQIFEVNEAHF